MTVSTIVIEEVSQSIQAASTAEIKDKNDVVIAKVPVPAITAQTKVIIIDSLLPGVTPVRS